MMVHPEDTKSPATSMNLVPIWTIWRGNGRLLSGSSDGDGYGAGGTHVSPQDQRANQVADGVAAKYESHHRLAGSFLHSLWDEGRGQTLSLVSTVTLPPKPCLTGLDFPGLWRG